MYANTLLSRNHAILSQIPQYDFPKMRGGQRPFRTFPKIHLFWYATSALIQRWGWLVERCAAHIYSTLRVWLRPFLRLPIIIRGGLEGTLRTLSQTFTDAAAAAVFGFRCFRLSERHQCKTIEIQWRIGFVNKAVWHFDHVIKGPHNQEAYSHHN